MCQHIQASISGLQCWYLPCPHWQRRELKFQFYLGLPEAFGRLSLSLSGPKTDRPTSIKCSKCRTLNWESTQPETLKTRTTKLFKAPGAFVLIRYSNRDPNWFSRQFDQKSDVCKARKHGRRALQVQLEMKKPASIFAELAQTDVEAAAPPEVLLPCLPLKP